MSLQTLHCRTRSCGKVLPGQQDEMKKTVLSETNNGDGIILLCEDTLPCVFLELVLISIRTWLILDSMLTLTPSITASICVLMSLTIFKQVSLLLWSFFDRFVSALFRRLTTTRAIVVENLGLSHIDILSRSMCYIVRLRHHASLSRSRLFLRYLWQDQDRYLQSFV